MYSFSLFIAYNARKNQPIENIQQWRDQVVLKSPITRIFGQSPIQPLQTHIEKVFECVSNLRPLFDGLICEDWDKVKIIRDQIARLEGEADVLKKEIRMNMPKGIFMPVSRRDLLEVLSMQDKMANKTKDIAGLVLGRKMRLPTEIQQLFIDFIDRSIAACTQAVKTVNELDELLETGFRGAELELVETMIHELDTIEHETDRIQIDIRNRLFGIEKDLPPIDVIFLYKVIDSTGDLGDLAQRVGSRLELMLAS